MAISATIATVVLFCCVVCITSTPIYMVNYCNRSIDMSEEINGTVIMHLANTSAGHQVPPNFSCDVVVHAVGTGNIQVEAVLSVLRISNSGTMGNCSASGDTLHVYEGLYPGHVKGDLKSKGGVCGRHDHDKAVAFTTHRFMILSFRSGPTSHRRETAAFQIGIQVYDKHEVLAYYYEQAYIGTAVSITIFIVTIFVVVVDCVVAQRQKALEGIPKITVTEHK